MKRYIFEQKTEPAYMTNADRIRAMTDEELAKFIEDTQIAGCPDPHEVAEHLVKTASWIGFNSLRR